MLVYKKVDLVLQTIVITVTVFLLFGKNPFAGIYGLVALGAVQVISMIVHFFLTPAIWNSTRRKIYYCLSVASLVILALVFFTDIIKDSITLMVWMIPVTGGIAIYYIIICLQEIKKLQQTEKRLEV